MKKRPKFVLVPFCLLVATGGAGAAVLVDFETTPNPLRSGANGGSYSNSANGAGDDFLNYGQGMAASTVYYDANGSDAGYSVFAVSIGNPLTVTANVTLPTANGSFGIFFGSPASSTGNSYLALFNVDHSAPSPNPTPPAGDDQFRFDNLFNASNGNVGGLGPGSVGGSTLGGTGVAGGAGVSPGTEFTISATYSILSATSYQISLTAGTVTSTRTYTGTPLSSVEVGFRTNPVSGTGTLDDISINRDPITVPEASTAMTALLGAFGLLAVRRRTGR